ncbi:MAG: hypothetical protein KAS36_12525 [Anaerolineales bacterium]|nr:hypothetical protein [Anaerolineales bacterium]
MNKFRSTFRVHLDEVIKEGQSHLVNHSWVDPETGGPDVEAIADIIQPFLGAQEKPPPWDADIAVSMGDRMGTAHEAIGDLPAAMGWCRIGRYVWRGDDQFESSHEGFPDYARRMTVGMLQMEAAICADRVGETGRAAQLFTWAVKNRSLTEEEVAEFDKTKQYYAVWEWTIQKAYALLCLGQWRDALEVAEDALLWIEKDSRARVGASHEMPLMILPVVLALAKYKENPNEENRLEANKMLDPQVVASRSHVDHLIGLFYIFNLRAKFPDLANPPEDELPPSARAKQGADACREWMKQADIQIDGSLESLKLLDQSLRDIYPTIEDDEKVKMVLFMWGSYFGEVVRNELAGGQWNFDAENMSSWTVDWDMGEIELHLWPFQRVKEYASGKTDQSTFELWQETEQAYLDLGLAAMDHE